MLREVSNQMFELQSIINEMKIRLCLDCGKCTAVCPVAKYDEEFNPRRIVQETLKQSGIGPVGENIWHCISCNMCMERCNYNVKFTEFIRFLRLRALSQGTDIKCNHSGIPQVTMHMMASGDIKQNRLVWLPNDIAITDQCDTAFFIGCSPYFDVMFNDLGVRTTEGISGALRLLNHAQVPFTLLNNERCCGRDLLLLGDAGGFLSLAQANISEFSKMGIKNIITSCPECYYTLKIDYPRVIDNWDIKVMHLTEIIAPLVENNKLTLGRIDKKITYHDPCTLGRYSRIFKQPRDILSSISGMEVVEMADNREKALCCGASPWAYCGMVHKQIQKERLGQAGDTGAGLLVTACPKCLIHFTCAQKNAESNGVCRIEVRDMFHLIAQSLSQEKSS